MTQAADQSLHMLDVTFQRLAAGGGQFVFGARQAALEALVGDDVTGILQLSGVRADIPIRGFERGLEIDKAQLLVRSEGADDSQPGAFMDHGL